MNRLSNMLVCILLVSVLAVSAVNLASVSEADGEEYNMTINIGTFLSEVESVTVTVGDETHQVALTENDNGFEGMLYGSIKLKLQDRTEITIEETDKYNGTKTVIEPDTTSNAYLWLTNYSVNGSQLTGNYDGMDYTLTIKDNDGVNTLEWSEDNEINDLRLGLTGNIIVDDVSYEFESAILPKNASVVSLAVTGMEVSVGGTVKIMEHVTSIFGNISSSSEFELDSAVESIESIILWNSTTGENQERQQMGEPEVKPDGFFTVTTTTYSQQLGFGGFKKIEKIWAMDTELDESDFSYSDFPIDSSNRGCSTWYLGGNIQVKENFFSTVFSTDGHSCKLSINILDGDVDYVAFMSQVQDSLTSEKILFDSLQFTGDAIGEQSTINSLQVNRITIGESVRAVGDNAFKNFKANIISVGSGIESIGDNSFENFSLSSSIPAFNEILSNVKWVGTNAFKGSCLTEADLSSAIKIGTNAFSDLYDLKRIVIGSNLESGLDLSIIFKDAGKNVDDPELITTGSSYTGHIWVPGFLGIPYSVSVNNVVFKILAIETDDGNKAFITGSDSNNENMEIPASVTLESGSSSKTYNVVEIYPGAFKNNTTLKEVTFKTSIIVGSEAFSGCTNLTSLNLEDGAELSEVQEYAFQKTGLESIDLSGCTELGTGAFDGCTSLTKVTLNELQAIPDYAFRGAPISDVVVEDGGSQPLTLDSIGAYAFSASVFTLDYLTVDSIGMNGLGYASVINLKITGTFEDSKNGLLNVSIDNLIVEGSSVTIPDEMFKGKTSLNTVTGDIGKVGANAFSGCTSLTTIDLSNTTIIGMSAFEGCSSLEGEILLNSVTKVNSKAFSGCISLTKVVVKDGATLYYDSFDDWSIVESDTEVRVSTYNGESWNYYVKGGQIVDADPDIEYIFIADDIASIGNYAFKECSALTTVEFSNDSNITSIGMYAFQGCTSLESIVIPGSVGAIGASAFLGCSALTEIELPSGLTEISYQMLRGTTSLTSVEIPRGVTSIGQSAFQNSGLESIDMSSTQQLVSIEYSAFSGCTSLVTVVLPKNLEKLGNISGSNDGVFQGCTSLTTVYVAGAEPIEGTLSLPSHIQTIGSRSFQGTSISRVDISVDVSELIIGEYAFYGISTLESISLKNSGTIQLLNYAFAYDTVLQSVSFDTQEGADIGVHAFSYCPTLGTDSGGNRVPLDLDCVVNVNTMAFSNCTSLSVVAVPAELTSIAYDAFVGCIMLDEFRLEEGNSVFSLDNDMLLDEGDARIAVIPTGLRSVTVPAGVTSFASGSEGSNSNVFTLLKDLEEILVEEGNSRYVSIDGWLAEIPSAEGGAYRIVSVPSSITTISVSTEHSLSIPSYILNGTEAKTITINGGSVILDSNSLVSDTLRNLEINSSGDVRIDANGCGKLNALYIEAEGDVTISGNLNVADFSVVSLGGSVSVTSGSLSGAGTVYFESGLNAADGSETGLEFPDGYFGGSAGTLSDLSLITSGGISGGSTLIGTGYISPGGSVVLGFETLEGAVAAIGGVTYYVQDDKTVPGIEDPKKFVVDDKYGVIRQVPVENSQVEYYVSSDIEIKNLKKFSWSGKGVEGGSETPRTLIMFETDDNHQTWDLKVWVCVDGSWTELSGDAVVPGVGYNLSGVDGAATQSDSVTKVILRVDALGATMENDYFRVTFDTNSSVSVPYMEVVEGRSILKSQLPTPVRVGYSFDGWDIKVDGKLVPYAQQQINSDTTLYAKWTDLDPYVDFIGNGGSFSHVVNGEEVAVTGGAFVSDQSQGGSGDSYVLAGEKYYLTMGTGYEFIGFDVTSTVSVEWDEGIENGRHYVVIHSVEGYATVSPMGKFYSMSSDLQGIIGVETVAPDEDLVLSWAFSNNPVMSGMTWHNTPGTPLIVNDSVYLHLGPAVYKLDIGTGKEVARADSVETGDFYNYVGYGGSGDAWYILDYATGKVLDENLEAVTTSGGVQVTLPKGMMYAKWYDGYFYTVFDGEIWKMDPTVTNPEGVMSNMFVPALQEGGLAPADIFSQYGTTASVLIEETDEGNPTMYWMSTDGSYRYIYAADLVDGDVSRVELTDIRGYFMDDGWLTYYDGYIYTTGYTQGLFGDKAVDGNSKIVYLSVDGTNMGTPASVELPGNRNSLLSGFVIVEGRGYVNATKGVTEGGDLLVYNIEDHVPVFVTSVASDSSHGGIVVSTANLDTDGGLNGYVNIYMMNYSGSNYLYVFTDRVSTSGGVTTWTMDGAAETKELAAGFGSQAIRVDPEGRIIFYNDSGALYCYVPAHLYSDYYFLIETDDGFEVVVAEGDDPEPYAAIEEAIWEAKRYMATYNESENTMTYANVLRYAYYYDGEMFRPLNTCPDLESLRYIVLLKESDYNNVDPDRVVYTTEGEGSGKISAGLPINVDGKAVTKVEMAVGEILNMTSTDDVKWASSDSSVVRVDSDGNVTAVSMGSALIVVSKQTDGKTVTSSCLVSVTSASLATIAESISSYADVGMTNMRMSALLSFELDGGTAADDLPSGLYEIGVKVTLPGLSEKGGITITKSGYTFAGWWDGSTLYKAGSDYIVSGSVTLKAYWIADKEPEVTSVTVTDSSGNTYNDSEIILSVSDDPIELSAITLPESSDGTVQWASDKPNVVYVMDGVLTALSPGTAKITVSALNGDARATFTVTVPGYKVEVSETTVSLKVGGQTVLSAGYEGGHPLMGPIEWTSSNPAVAIVSSDGTVTAVSAGTAVVTAKAPNGNTAQCVVAVSSPQVTISGSSLLYVGESATFKATAEGVGGFTWQSSNPSSVTVDQNGRVTAVAEGYAVITATADDGSGASASITVTVQSVKAESVEIDRSSLTLTVGGTQTLKATVGPDDAANKAVVWSSSNPQVASVSSAGVVTAIAPGTAVITVTTVDGSLTDSCTVTVQGEVSSIVLDRTVVSLKVSETSKLGATTAPQEGAKITWKSSDTKVVSVSADGTIRGVSPGTATITATCGDVSATCTVTVYGDSEVVDKGTVDNPDGTKTNTTEETIDAGDSTVVKTTETTTDADGNVQGTEVSITATTEGSRTETNVTVITDSAGNSTAESTTTVPATVTTSNGRQTITVSLTDVTAAAEQISSIAAATGQDVIPTVVIDIGSSQQETVSSTLTITEGAMSAIAANPGTQVRVDTGVGSIQMSGEVVSEMAGMGGDVRVSVTQVFESDLTDVQTSAVAGASVFSLTATAGSEQIHQLGGTATVRLPHSLDGGKAEDVRVYYMDDTGQLVEHACKYDEESGTVEFKTIHFSYFVVSNGSLIDGGSGASSDDDDGIQTLLTVTVGLLAVLIAMMGVGMYLAFVRGRP